MGSDGGVFSFGDATFRGAWVDHHRSTPSWKWSAPDKSRQRTRSAVGLRWIGQVMARGFISSILGGATGDVLLEAGNGEGEQSMVRRVDDALADQRVSGRRDGG